jgi:hypothetical protein
MYSVVDRAIVLAVACCVLACSGRPQDAKLYPASLIGRWERQLSDKIWGDTLELRANGTVGGVASNPIPTTARWYVKRNALGGETFCATDKDGSSCRSFEVSGDLLIVHGGPARPTTFRRVR